MEASAVGMAKTLWPSEIADTQLDALRFVPLSLRISIPRSRQVRRALRRALVLPDQRQCLGLHHSAQMGHDPRSEEHTSELQSLMRISYDVFCLKKKKNYYNI